MFEGKRGKELKEIHRLNGQLIFRTFLASWFLFKLNLNHLLRLPLYSSAAFQDEFVINLYCKGHTILQKHY